MLRTMYRTIVFVEASRGLLNKVNSVVRFTNFKFQHKSTQKNKNEANLKQFSMQIHTEFDKSSQTLQSRIFTDSCDYFLPNFTRIKLIDYTYLGIDWHAVINVSKIKLETEIEKEINRI